MDIPIKDPRFDGRGLTVRTAGIWSSAKVLLDGSPQAAKKGRFVIRDNSGRDVVLLLKFNGIDPIPTLKIDDVAIELARPLRWYEYVWIGLPIALFFVGGALGALIGLGATYGNARILRSERSVGSRYALTTLLSAGATVTFIVLAAAFRHFVSGRAI